MTEYVPGFDTDRFEAHERFFVDEVPRWVADRFGVTSPVERTAVWGASLGAELALAVGLRHPDRYSAILAASPGAGYQPPPVLPDPVPPVYLVAGTDEPFFLGNAARWAAALQQASAEVVMLERTGGHGDAFWAHEFPLMVAWAFGPESTRY